MKPQSKYSAPDFDTIVLLIQQARSRAFSKVNAELVLLYFTVGKVVAEKVANGLWGEGTVDELALFIEKNIAGIKERALPHSIFRASRLPAGIHSKAARIRDS